MQTPEKVEMVSGRVVAADSTGSPVAAGRNKVAKPKRRYIFEIFDQKSCVEYYESFAAHAFESSTSVRPSGVQHWPGLMSNSDTDDHANMYSGDT